MIHCPNCKEEMTEQSLDATIAIKPIIVGRCDQCCLLWFDDSASIRLAPGAVLEVFKQIGSTGKTEHVGTDEHFDCPRCRQQLAITHDLQRSTRFTYWRCPTDHGQLFGFTQFLREKNFIRSPSPAELAKIRSEVGQIACSHCGAPINLQTESSCAYCGSPITIVDPDSVAKAVHELRSAGTGNQAPNSADAIASRLGDAQLRALLEQEQRYDRNTRQNLVVLGIGAMAALLETVL